MLNAIPPGAEEVAVDSVQIADVWAVEVDGPTHFLGNGRTPKGHHRELDIVILKGPRRGVFFLMSKAYPSWGTRSGGGP
jgi:hypothetical protein